jgi:sarcosine oxidase, subunit beta
LTEAPPDAVIIGAGVMGCAIAFELAQHGWRTLTVDAGPAAGAGSTSSSSACIRFHYSTWDAVLVAWEAHALWERWREHLGVDDEAGMARFVRTGGLVLDTPGSNRDVVLALFDAAGVPYEEWDADMVAARVPGLDTGRYFPPRAVADERFWAAASGHLGAYYTPDAGFVDDPQLAAHNLMVAATAHGAQFRFCAKVVEVIRTDGRVAGLRLDDGTVVATAVVINAAGPHSSRINTLAGVTDDMRVTTRPLRQEVHVVEAPGRFRLGSGGTFVTDGDLGTYFRVHLGDTILVGGLEPACDPLQFVADPDVYRDTPTVEVFEAQTLRLSRRVPDVTVPPRPVGVAALYDVTEDWLPIYDRSSLDGFYLACGTSGNQFKNAPMVGRLMAALVTVVESGHDHDRDPVRVACERGPHSIDVGHFSRLRERAATSSSVMG